MFFSTPLRPSAILVAILASGQALASDINALQTLNQAEFAAINKDLISALSHKSIMQAAPRSITGFDLGVSVSATRLNNSSIWQKATSGNDMNILPIPRLHLTKGLPFGVDIGATYTALPDSNIKLWSGEVKYALLEGSALTPAMAVRGTYSKLQGVNQLDFHSTGFEALISKGFVGFTPYAGAGVVRGRSEAKNLGQVSLSAEAETVEKYFAGVNWNIMLGNLALEYDRTGNNDSLSLKLGVQW